MNHDAYDDSYIREILNGVKTIAMVGASPVNVRPSYFAFKYLAQRGYDLVESIFAAARELIAECPCEEGCPSCVGSAQKTYTYYDAGGEARERIPDKEAALVVLHEMLRLEPYVPKGPAGSQKEAAEPIPQLPASLESKVRRQLQRLKAP